MKHLCLILCFATVAFGAKVGDTYQQVLAEKGNPKSQIEAGTLRVLKYPDASIEIRGNLVVSIKPVTVAPPAAPAPAATPQEQIATVKRTMENAVLHVKQIVNQPVTTQPVVPPMRVQLYHPGWFHEGATKPDFNTVDVRQTQQMDYDRFPYVSSDLNPGVAFVGPELEFNSMTKYFYLDRSVPKKKLTEAEMVEINRLYRIIGKCEQQLNQLQETQG
jgi:hypothetical protein